MNKNRGQEAAGELFSGSGGVSWVSPGSKPPVGRFLDASWAALGQFLRRLWRLWGGSWAVLGTKLGRLGRIFAPKWNQVGIKID